MKYRNSKKNKKYSKKYSKKLHKKTRRSRKNIFAKGKQYNCCICDKKINSEFPLTPARCLTKLGKNSHKICSDCWWNNFAKEGVNHKCPGCPVEEPKTSKTLNNEIIDLVSSSDD
jgi:hypothetical protein